MPRLSDAMEEGTILRWLKRTGDEVRRGEPLVEIETDKATELVEAHADGVVEVLAGAGTVAPVGAALARIIGVADERVLASPMARRLAREEGIDLSSVPGSGPGGRIVAADVTGPPAPAPEPETEPEPVPVAVAPELPAVGGTAKGDTTAVELTRPQQTIARRVAEAKATMPEVTLAVEIDLEPVLALLDQLGARALDPRPELDDLLVKACGVALAEVPRANASFRDNRFELHGRVNVGLVVPTKDSVIIPTLFDADRTPVPEIARRRAELLARVQTGAIAAPELSGATFTLTNLGSYGVTRATAVLTPPHAAALAVGAVVARAVPAEGVVAVRRVMEATLTCDHRILYGAEAARFAARIRELLEAPAALLL